MPQKTYIALLRGINVSGRNMIAMPELRSLCAHLGWVDVQSYIQSGNLVFKANSAPPKLEEALEDAITQYFGLTIPIIVRAATAWPAYVQGNPFPDASQSAPNAVLLALAKAPPKEDAVEKLRERATNGERIIQVDDALWLHFGAGVAKSKLSPAVLDRLVGSPVTARNWRTVLKLHEMACLPSSQPEPSTKRRTNRD
jgi:uncharacterized protein (DUF1697 family)